jgi:uracil-DNA glycosylase
VGCDNYCPPSLRNVLLEIKSDKKNLDIDSAIKAKDYRDVWGVKQASQGVLLLNTALTVEQGKPGSHLKTWKKFTKEVIKSIMMTQADIVWLLWGRPAQKLYDECTDTIEVVEKLPLDPDWADWIKNCELGQYVHTLTDDLKSVNFHYSLRTSHPSPFSANNQLNDCPAFIGSNCFVNCNNILSEIGRNKIEW